MRGAVIDASTVYRTVDRLCDLGVLRRSHIHDGVTKFHHAEVPPHQHLRCRTCGDDVEIPLVDLAALTEALRARYGFVVDAPGLGLHGLCRNCQG